MLHEVSHDGHTIHLFGGSRPTTTPWSSPAIEALAASREEFWNEAPVMGPEVQALAVTYGVDPARPLATWLSDEDGARLAAAAEANGANAALLAQLRPWLAAQVLRMAADAHDGLHAEYAAEAILTKRAADAGLPINSEFGTPEDTLASFASMPPEVEVQYLRWTLYEIESGTERVTLHAEALARGDLTPIAEETAMMRREWPALYEHLVVKRNHAWLPRIDAMFAAHTRAFVVVGTGHLVGDDGLLALLPRAGFSVRKVQP
jgi:uncharacterized protein YbaP (TraB family)